MRGLPCVPRAPGAVSSAQRQGRAPVERSMIKKVKTLAPAARGTSSPATSAKAGCAAALQESDSKFTAAAARPLQSLPKWREQQANRRRAASSRARCVTTELVRNRRVDPRPKINQNEFGPVVGSGHTRKAMALLSAQHQCRAATRRKARKDCSSLLRSCYRFRA